MLKTASILSDDRRGSPRYEHQVELRFEQQGRDGTLRIGHGITEDVSRRGIRFRTEEPPEVGTEVITRIPWPSLLQNVCPLELIARGVIARDTTRGIILVIRSYEFRTCGARSFWEPPAASSNIIFA